MISRRSLLGAMLAAAAPPAFVRYGSLMVPTPLKVLTFGPDDLIGLQFCPEDMRALSRQLVGDYLAAAQKRAIINHLSRGEFGRVDGITIISSPP